MDGYYDGKVINPKNNLVLQLSEQGRNNRKRKF